MNTKEALEHLATHALMLGTSKLTGEAIETLRSFVADREEELSRAYDSPLTQAARGYPATVDPLDARHMAEHELGFSSSAADGVPYAQLVAAAKELRDLRAFREAYSRLQEAYARALTLHFERGASSPKAPKLA